MSQSRFSIVLVGVSALLRRPLVSRLRPADGERSPWMVFTARVGRFDSGGRWAGWPSGSLLPLFGMHRFGNCPRRVGLRAHDFRFSARTASGLPSAGWFCRLPLRRLPLGGLTFGLPFPFFGTHRFGVAVRQVGASAGRVGLRVRSFRFSARAASGLPLVGLAFGLTASAFRHAPLRGYPRRVGSSAFRFGVCHSAGWPSGSRLPLFGTHRSAPPHRRREGRRSTPTRHLFHFKTLIPTC